MTHERRYALACGSRVVVAIGGRSPRCYSVTVTSPVIVECASHTNE
jgi:hypothetical protein